MKYFVVTCPSNGWDCVVGLYKAKSIRKVEEQLEKEYGEDWEDEYVIHHKYLEQING